VPRWERTLDLVSAKYRTLARYSEDSRASLWSVHGVLIHERASFPRHPYPRVPGTKYAGVIDELARAEGIVKMPAVWSPAGTVGKKHLSCLRRGIS